MHCAYYATEALGVEIDCRNKENVYMSRRCVSLTLALVWLSFVLSGQSDRGTITGTVVDPTGAVVPSAKLTLTNTGTSAAYETVTTATGNYTIPSLPAGT